jgi:hypothetical protein
MVHTRRSGDLEWVEYKPDVRSLSDPYEVSSPVALVTHVGQQALVAYDGMTKLLPRWLKMMVNP